MSGPEIQYTAYLTGSLKLSKTGVWLHNNQPFTNPKVIAYFDSGVVWDEADQKYYVRLGKQQATFDVEDTAFFVVELLDSAEPWQIRLQNSRVEPLDLSSLVVGKEDQIYCKLENGKLARFSRNSHQALIAYAVTADQIMVNDHPYRIEKV